MTNMARHHTKTAGDTWITPLPFINALGPFDLDPCAAVDQPWRTATVEYTIEDDGLAQDWKGFAWVNPPYSAPRAWARKLANHGGGGLLMIFARTDTELWHQYVFGRARCVLFLRSRIVFCLPDGSRSKYRAGAPVAIVGYGQTAVDRIRAGKMYTGGALVYL